MLSGMRPMGTMFSPVAVMMTSASSSLPDPRRMPFSVKRAILSVTTEAAPLESASNRSRSGTMHMRWSQGS